ncbi:phosphatase PAP2 family protein [Rhodococcus chondri]|uniref:Phosphatase PAP2 family protein n=1 Tax=Rhodococcus chondri TaxID=3065941 RepID=A0ABU7JUZ0_9NOCA|nr:phosphatase PAP2 family protein [Rhodococcus sp. CC-R104]MEE2033838.1 phosphatase PAP2 family protein [Rhodococcus sp. CC-R104]
MSPTTDEPRESAADALAQRVEVHWREAFTWAEALRELAAVDRAVFEAIARTPTGTLDVPIRRLSNFANHSRLWLAVASAIGLAGGNRGRRAATVGVASIAVTSATVNVAVKPVFARRRPDRAGLGLFDGRHIASPGSTSFPSGHAASGFAFAWAVSRDLPVLSVPLGLLAAAVAYSRVHTGVHYPGDVIVGSVLGTATAATVAAVRDRYSRRNHVLAGL